MKTLLERLKPEYKAKLDGEIKNKYNATYERLNTVLTKNHSLDKITYEMAIQLDTMLNNSNGSRVMSVYNLFNFPTL